MSTYLFDNAGEQAGQRFSSLETLYDPWTIRHLEATGIGAGWHCWEVGGGGGSIAAWLAVCGRGSATPVGGSRSSEPLRGQRWRCFHGRSRWLRDLPALAGNP